MPPEPAILEVQGLGKRFGPSAVLRSLDFALRRGEILLVLGENGSGKSTLLRILAGLLRPSSGTVRLNGQPLHSSDPGSRRFVGLLSHASHMYHELTLRENLVFVARLYGVNDPAAAAALAIVTAGLESRADEPVGRLSRGMVQRGAIARAFLHSPELMLVDEPFTALDAPSAGRIREWLADRARDRRAIVLVTHQPAEVWDLATHVGVLARGAWAILEPRPPELSGFLGRYHEAIRV